ncbi:MAG: T9SS type A sorting domain-containing protein [Lacibacter sp.]
MKKFLLSALPMLILVSVSFSQTTNTEMFETTGPVAFSPAPNGFAFTGSTAGFITGSTSAGSRPASTAYGFGGSATAYNASNNTRVITSGDLSTVGVNFAALTFKLMAVSLGSTTNGMENTDFVRVEISPNGGTNWYSTLQITGAAAGSSWWDYSATGIAQTNYDGNATPVTVAAANGGQNLAGPSTVIIRGLPIGITNLRVRITLECSNNNERWAMDAILLLRTNNAPLPVNFANVSAKQTNGGVLVSFSNLTESDLNYYEIERSTDGRNFTSIGKVQPKGNDYGKWDYSFTDVAPANKSYYRIKSVEFSNTTKFSVILKVSSERTANAFVVYPNPVQNKVVTLQANNIAAGAYSVTILNSNGQQVFAKTMNFQAGSVSQSIELPASVKPGMYMLRIENAGTRSVTSLFVQ